MAEFGSLYFVYVNVQFFLAAICEVFGNVLTNLGLCQCRKKATLRSSLKGKTVLITGANSGIGKECAKTCARLGAKVVMACRDIPKARQAVDNILAEIGADKAVNLMLVELDLASLDSVRECAKDVNQKVWQLFKKKLR